MFESHCLLVGCSEKRQRSASIDVTGANYAKDFELDRPQWSGPSPGGLCRQGRRHVLWLHPVPGCLPDHHGRAGVKVKPGIGRRWRPAAGLICHGGPSARYARKCSRRYMANFDPTFPGAHTPRPSKLAAVGQRLQGLLQSVSTVNTPTSYTMDHSAGSYMLRHPGPLAPVHPLRQRRRAFDGRYPSLARRLSKD